MSAMIAGRRLASALGPLAGALTLALGLTLGSGEARASGLRPSRLSTSPSTAISWNAGRSKKRRSASYVKRSLFSESPTVF